MADDLKISDMVEIGTGDLHDDLAFEVIDPNEALVEDQNKQVKLVTLEASFGAEDKIFEGDSSVEVIDTGTGRIEITTDGDLIAVQSSNEQKFSIEEGEVGGIHEVLDLDGPNSTIFLGRQVEVHLRVGTGSDPTVRVMSGTDEWLYIHGDSQRLGPGGTGNDITVTSGGIGASLAGINNLNLTGLLQRIGPAADTNIELNQTANTIIAEIANAIRFEMNNNHGIIGNQAALRLDVDWGDDFDIKAYDNANVQNFHLTTNVQEFGTLGDTYFHIDQATGIYTFRCNNNIELTLGPTGLTLSAGATVDNIETTLTNDDTHIPTSGAVFDAIAGSVPDKIFEGDSSVEVIDAGTGQVDITVDAGLVARFLASGNMELGQDDTVRGILKFFGDAGGNGGRFELYKGATGTGSQRYYCEITGDDFYLGQAFAETLSYTAATSMWRASPNFRADTLRLTSGATGIDTIETTLTDDDTHIPTSGAVVDAIAAITNTKIEQLNTKVEVSDTGTDGQVDIIADGFTLAKATSQGFFVGGTDGNFERMIHDAGAFYMINDFVNGDTLIRGTVTGPTVNTMMRLYPDGGIDFHENGALKMSLTADGLELKDDQTGAEGIGNAATTVAITFGTAHADANYQVLATVENTTDVTPLVLSAIITAKATTGFTATLSAATDSANYVLNWLVVRS